MMGLFILISARQVLSRPFRNLLLVFGITLGIALSTSIELINQSTLEGFKQSLNAMAGGSQLSISGPKTGFSESLLSNVETTQGVKFAIPMVENWAYSSDTSTSFVVLGIDLLKEGAVRSYKTTSGEDLLEDPLVFLNQPDSIILTNTFAKAQNLKLGSTVAMLTASGKKDFVIRGLLEDEGVAKAFGGNLAIMDIDGARYTFGKTGKYDRIDIILADDANVDAIKESLTKNLPAGLRVDLPTTQGESFAKLVATFQELLKFLSLLAVLVGFFIVYNTIAITLMERRRELATLQTLGASKEQVFLLILCEGLLLALLAGVFGTFLGLAMANALSGEVQKSLMAQTMSPITLSHLKLSADDFLRSLAISGAAVFFAIAVPLRRHFKTPLLINLKNLPLAAAAKKKIPMHLIGLVSFIILFSVTKITTGKPNGLLVLLEVACGGLVLLGLAPLLLRTIARFLSYFVRKGSSYLFLFRMNLDLYHLQKDRAGANSMGLLVTFFLVVALSIINFSFQSSILGWIRNSFTMDYSLSLGGSVITTQVQPISDNILEEIKDLKFLKKDSEGRSTLSLRILDFEMDQNLYKIKAFDRLPDFAIDSIFSVSRGSTIKDAKKIFEGNNILISSNMQDRLGLKVGENLMLPTPSGNRAFTITGVVTDYLSPTGVVYMDRKYAKELWQDSLVTSIFVSRTEDISYEEARGLLTSTFGSRGIVITDNKSLLAQAETNIKDGFAMTKAIELAALVIALFGLLNTLFISVLQRLRELGVMRSTGLTRPQLVFSILSESAIQSGLASLAAVFFGTLLCKMWVVPLLSGLLGWPVQAYIPWESLLMILVFGVVLGTLAGIIPSIQVGRMKLRETLENE